MIKVRKATEDEVATIAKLSDEIIKDLGRKRHADYFGGVDEDEVSEAMEGESTTFVAVNETDEIVGFLLALKSDTSYCINGYGVKTEYQGKGIAKMLMKTAEGYALDNGVTVLDGTVHPDNIASRMALQSIGVRYFEGEEFVHHTKDGRELRRKTFTIEL